MGQEGGRAQGEPKLHAWLKEEPYSGRSGHVGSERLDLRDFKKDARNLDFCVKSPNLSSWAEGSFPKRLLTSSPSRQ